MVKKLRRPEDAGHLPWYPSNLRIKGVLPYQKLGGIMFYRYEDIARLLNGDKVAER